MTMSRKNNAAALPPDVFAADDAGSEPPASRALEGSGEVRASGLSISERALRQSAPPYLEGLNAEQREAVETLDGPVLVLAGAGTGKTRVLTTRIAHILASGRANGHQVLAVTFTNKAAREMKSRIGGLVGGAVEGMPWLGTFHAIGVKILRRHAELVDLKSGFTILDVDDQLRLVKQVVQADGLDEKRWPARQLAGLIDHWKNRGVTPDKVPAGESFAFGNGKGADLYAAYQTRLKELNATDFGDLLLECLRLFRQNPDVLESYQKRFRFMLVDEYQDTNVAQYLWLRLLAQGNANVCCVGDDDQSIYGWRGAEVDNILRFEADFAGAKVIRLERNYRSTGHILAAASGLIAHNRDRLGKTLRTEDIDGEKVAVTGVWDDEEEARNVCANIEHDWEEAKKRAVSELPLGASDADRQHAIKTLRCLNETAILVRASFQMRAFEDRFVTLGLPYRVIGGPRFYERQEIKDAVAYLSVMYNPANDLKFERIVNVPKRGLGDATVKLIHAHARSREIPMAQAALELTETEELKARARNSLTGLMTAFARWRGMAGSMPHTELAELILDESGYTAMWQKDKSPQAQSRLENLKELIRFMHEFETLEGFLEHVSLVMDADGEDDGDRLSLMTLHAAKGLEFDTVYLPGWEEGLFPHQRSLDENGQAGLEEERRLAHVGITRARKRASISFAQNRRVRGLWQAAIPSRFVDELPEDHVSVIEADSPFGGYANPFSGGQKTEPAAGFASPYETPGWQRAQRNRRSGAQARQDRASPYTLDGELVASSTGHTSSFELGERVFHQKFGYGEIIEIDGNKLTIAFDKAGEKRVVDSFVERH